MRRMIRQRRLRRLNGRHLRLGVLCVLPLVTVLYLLMRCRPVITEFAKSDAEWIAEKTANETVAYVLENKEEQCRSLVQLNYDNDRVLSNVLVDAATVNVIKTAVTTEVMKRMEDMSTMTVSIPLGTLMGWDWLSGFGPLIPFSIGVNSSVLSSVSSSLSAVGINQSSYRVLIHLEISLCVVTPAGQENVAVETTYPMAETVFLGDVPNALTEVSGDTRTSVGKIMDYNAQNSDGE